MLLRKYYNVYNSFNMLHYLYQFFLSIILYNSCLEYNGNAWLDNWIEFEYLFIPSHLNYFKKLKNKSC